MNPSGGLESKGTTEATLCTTCSLSVMAVGATKAMKPFVSSTNYQQMLILRYVCEPHDR